MNFELHANNRPFDPQKADIPTGSRVPELSEGRFHPRGSKFGHRDVGKPNSTGVSKRAESKE